MNSLLMGKQKINQDGQGEIESSCIRGALHSRTVNISSLKDFAAEYLQPDHPLRLVLFAQDDVMSAEAFLAMIPVWLKLARYSTKR
jgi:hypothetical protein